jgi:hypothetical protein
VWVAGFYLDLQVSRAPSPPFPLALVTRIATAVCGMVPSLGHPGAAWSPTALKPLAPACCDRRPFLPPQRYPFAGRQGDCPRCPEGTLCQDEGITLATLPLKPGFWRVGPRSPNVLPCATTVACGGPATDYDSELLMGDLWERGSQEGADGRGSGLGGRDRRGIDPSVAWGRC